MRQILLIDESSLFCDYLSLKLKSDMTEINVAINGFDGMTKIRSNPPDMIIMNIQLSRLGAIDVLKQKAQNPNVARVPVIMLTQQLNQEQMITLIPFHVKRVLTKPIALSTLYALLSRELGIPFIHDDSPGTMSVCVNDDIIFISITEGINLDVLDTLAFKINELITLYDLAQPKIIISLYDLKLTFADAPNVYRFFQIAQNASKSKHQNVKVLSHDGFVRKFIQGHRDFTGIEIVENIKNAVMVLLDTSDRKPEIPLDKLNRTARFEHEYASFDTKARFLGISDLKDASQSMHLAVVDDDSVTFELFNTMFSRTNIVIDVYSDGASYVEGAKSNRYDLVFLDMDMPKMNGLEVIREIATNGIKQKFVLLATSHQREVAFEMFRQGVRDYLIKPLRPGDIFKKFLEVLFSSF
jgi:DNA-binding response OmpR family regulator